MTDRITAVVENGCLRPNEPLDIPDGREVEVRITLMETPEGEEQRKQRLLANLARLQGAAAKYPDEWWDEFQTDLRDNWFDTLDRLTNNEAHFHPFRHVGLSTENWTA
jgi:predicted DNA-binding antitoxin AbrB/MazE fold protein